jgi:hypothetical protein
MSEQHQSKRYADDRGRADVVGIASYGDVASLGHVSRARISQIMNLLNLARSLHYPCLASSPGGTGWVRYLAAVFFSSRALRGVT